MASLRQRQPSITLTVKDKRKVKGASSAETALLEGALKSKSDTVGKAIVKKVSLNCRDKSSQDAPIHVATESGFVDFDVQRVDGSTGPVGVSYATQSGTAMSDVDFVAATGDLSWYL